jgi:superfamily II DNA or RNA helicase
MANKILLYPTYIEVICDRNDTETQNKMMQFYPNGVNRIKTIYRLSIHKTPEVLQALRGGIVDTTPEKVKYYYHRELNIRQVMDDLLNNGAKQSGRISRRLTLMPHQELGREIAWCQDRFAFYFDTRTGKTPLSLAIINDDIQEHPDHKWLVVCPLILLYNAWLPDAEKFFPDLQVVNCHAASPERRHYAMAKKGHIYLTNTESFVRYREDLEKIGFTGCIVDESSDMKSNRAKVSQELVDFAQTLERFYLLSGTPAPNGEYEYYMQMKAIDYYGWQSSYTQFKEYYFVNLSYNPQYEKLALRPDRHDELYNKIKQSAIFIDKVDVLDLPGREFYPVKYDMPVDLSKYYKQLKNELYVELAKDSDKPILITAANVGAKLNKLNQVSSGFIMDTRAAKENKAYGTENTEWYLLNDYRFKELLKLLDKEGIRGEQVLIWANYRKEFDLIKNLLGSQCACVYGGVSIDEKNDAIRRFKDGTIRYLVANPASADKGLTLTNCHICIYFSLNYSYELYKQSYDRIYADRSIQPHFCEYYIMLAKGTIDEVLYNEVLSGKAAAGYAVLNHLKPEVIKEGKHEAVNQ